MNLVKALAKKAAGFIQRESEILDATGLEITRDYIYIRRNLKWY